MKANTHNTNPHSFFSLLFDYTMLSIIVRTSWKKETIETKIAF